MHDDDETERTQTLVLTNDLKDHARSVTEMFRPLKRDVSCSVRHLRPFYLAEFVTSDEQNAFKRECELLGPLVVRDQLLDAERVSRRSVRQSFRMTNEVGVEGALDSIDPLTSICMFGSNSVLLLPEHLLPPVLLVLADRISSWRTEHYPLDRRGLACAAQFSKTFTTSRWGDLGPRSDDLLLSFGPSLPSDWKHDLESLHYQLMGFVCALIGALNERGCSPTTAVETRPNYSEVQLLTGIGEHPPRLGYLIPVSPDSSGVCECLQIVSEEHNERNDIGITVSKSVLQFNAGFFCVKAREKFAVRARAKQTLRQRWLSDVWTKVQFSLRGVQRPESFDEAYRSAGISLTEKLDRSEQEKILMVLLGEYWERNSIPADARISDVKGLGLHVEEKRGAFMSKYQRLEVSLQVR